MSVPTLTAEQLGQYKSFVEQCIANPNILHEADFAFVKQLIEHFGGKVPEKKPVESPSKKPPEPPNEAEMEAEPESEESDLELDMSGVIEPDPDVPQPMGDTSVEPTEEQIDQSQEKRSQAVAAFMEKDYEKAVELYTEAILLNPQAVLLYSKRGQAYLFLNKPNACIRDCNRALELNPDSAAAHKFRGRAYRLLGRFEEAANDLRLACRLDFDEQADEWLREVTPNAKRIEEHKRKYERKQQEKRAHERLERIKQAKEANKKAQEEGSTATATDGGGGGEQNQNAFMQDFLNFIPDSDVMKSFEDPEIGNAIVDIAKNPMNVLKYQNNPKVMSFLKKAAKKLEVAGNAGFPGVPPQGCPSAQPPSGEPADAKPPQDDIGLD